MTLQEAIEIKLQWRKDNYPPALPGEMNADKLSIAALQIITEFRKTSNRDILYHLPGETK